MYTNVCIELSYLSTSGSNTRKTWLVHLFTCSWIIKINHCLAKSVFFYWNKPPWCWWTCFRNLCSSSTLSKGPACAPACKVLCLQCGYEELTYYGASFYVPHFQFHNTSLATLTLQQMHYLEITNYLFLSPSAESSTRSNKPCGSITGIPTIHCIELQSLGLSFWTH